MDDDHLARRLTRKTALRVAAAGAMGLALGVRPGRAAPGDGAAVEAAARTFLASLTAAQRERATFAFYGSERTRWHWTVPSSVPRKGLPLGVMSPDQRRLALALLRASTSASGYRKALDIMALQAVLRRMNTGISDPFDPDLFYVSVFGTPGARAWGWRSKGTISQGTSPWCGTRSWPSRSSSAPGRPERAAHTVRSRPAIRTMPREEDAAREIVLSLDRALRGRVVFSSESLTTT